MRYRGSVLGPIWMVANLGIVVVGVTLLYSELLKQPVNTFMPYLVVSLLLMNFIWPVLIEGCHAFASAPDVLRQVNLPAVALVMRVMYRNLIVVAHNSVLVLIVFAYFNRFGEIRVLELAFGIALLLVNLWWATLLFAILGARFRDMIQILTSVLNFMGIFTPIYWVPALISKNQILLDINPLYHLFQIVRQPWLGQQASLLNYEVVIGAAIIGPIVTWTVFLRTRRQIVFWV